MNGGTGGATPPPLARTSSQEQWLRKVNAALDLNDALNVCEQIELDPTSVIDIPKFHELVQRFAKLQGAVARAAREGLSGACPEQLLGLLGRAVHLAEAAKTPEELFRYPEELIGLLGDIWLLGDISIPEIGSLVEACETLVDRARSADAAVSEQDVADEKAAVEKQADALRVESVKAL